MVKRAKRIQSCDGGHDTTGSVRRLETGGGSGVRLCRAHWAAEMVWRRRRNKTLTGKARFPILKFPGGR